MLKKALVAASTLLLALVTLTLVVLLGSVTHADAIAYSDWIDGERFTSPLPGQLYAVSGEGKVEGQLCQLNRNDFRIGTDALPGRTFVNRLGETVPVVLWIARVSLQPDQPAEQQLSVSYRLEWRSLDREFATLDALALGVQRIMHERDLAQIKRHASSAHIAELQRLEGCAEAIVQTFKNGLDVCQLTEVLKESTGRILAVRFGAHCLALDPDGAPRTLPELADGSFWTIVKLGLGLVDQLLAAPVLAGNETG